MYCNGTQGRHPAPDFEQLPIPYDGIGSPQIQEPGVEVKHIPGGCTSLCQSVDVGLNKPFMDHIWKMWIKWMINKGISQGRMSMPTRHDVSMWVDKAMGQMKEEQ
jgi:hypothetical protein